jgi:nucleoside-diphosphate-sugar epimerase
MDRDKILHAAANAVAAVWLSSQDATSEQMLVGAANLLSASSLADAERRHVIFSS